jgi:hypothetical protein
VSVLLPTELTQTEIDNISQFTKNFEIRVRLFRDIQGATYSSTSIADGDYASGTGIYTISNRIWLKRVNLATPTGYDLLKIEYEDSEGNYIVAKSYKFSGTDHDLKVPVFAKKFRFTFFKESDPTDTAVPGTSPNPQLYEDSWFDITPYIGEEIRIENNIGDLNGSFKLPFVSIVLNNDNGRWSKKHTASSFQLNPIYATRSDSETQGSIQNVVKKQGLRINVEIKFYGKEWQSTNWIVLATFHARKFTDRDVAGESGWIAKVLYKTPIVEGATLGQIIEDYIVRKDGDMLLQLNKKIDDEIITVSNEVVGEADLEPTLPTKILDTKQIHCHTQDDKYIYYALKDVSGANTDAGGFIEVRRITKSGSNDELVGKIYALPIEQVISTNTYNWLDGNFLSDSDASINNNNAFKRMIRAAYSMVVDGTHIYISILNVVHGEYDGPEPGNSGIWTSDSFLLKLPKEGGWETLVGSGIKITEENTPKTIYTISSGGEVYGYSLGFRVIVSAGTPAVSTLDPYDAQDSGVWLPIIRGLMLFDDNGTEKLMFIKEKGRDNTVATTMSEFWVIDKDLTGAVQRGSADDKMRVECVTQYSDIVMYVCFSTWSSGSLQSKELGILSIDKSDDSFFVADYGKAGLAEWFLSMSILLNGIYSSGNSFDGNTYTPNNESVASDGIKEKYQSVFILDGFNLVHFNHATRNEFLSFSQPEVFLGGVPVNFNTVKYAEEFLSGNLFVTTGWVLDLLTGTLVLRQAIASTDLIEVTANYDFLRSVMFYEGESESRLNAKGIGEIAQASLHNFGIDECECLDKLRFVENQNIPIRHDINDYQALDDDDGEYNEGSGYLGIRTTRTIGDDELVSFQFTPAFDGIVEFIRVPFKLVDVSGAGSLDSGDDIPKDFDLYLTNAGIDYSSSDGINIDTAPTSASILVLSEGAESVYIAYDKLDATTDESQYIWLSFDVSAAARSVVAGSNYGIIMRTHNTGDLFHYVSLGKKVDNVNNRVAVDAITDGQDITTHSPSWNTRSSSEGGGAIFAQVSIKKTKQELKSTNIIDSLNPNISSGFVSVQGGSNSTISVVSDDFSTEYVKATDYTITYSGGKFYINFTASAALDDIDKSVIVRWFESTSDLIIITDRFTNQKIISEQSEFGDLTTYLRVIVNGQKLRPADTNVKIDKVFDLYPGILLDLENENEQTKKIETTEINQWNDNLSKYEAADDLEGEASKFVFEFNDPFIIGTTAYIVKYGKGHSNGASADDPVNSGSKTAASDEDVPKFYEIPVSAFSEANYHVMLKPNQYREWRLATSDDYSDMAGNTEGTPPSSASDVFTSAHFYLKHMNSAFDEDTANWIAYTSEERIFYLDKDGVVIRDDSYLAASSKNPIPSSYPDKTIFVKIEPVDFAGNPLFEAHSESGEDGYDADMLSSVKKYMANNIDRVTIRSRGISAVYSNFDTQKKFLRITVLGYPINNLVRVRDERRKSGFEHADANKLQIDNKLIQTQVMAQRIGAFSMEFWGQERINFTKDIVFDPRIRPSAVVRVSSEKENLEDNLFYVTTVSSLLSSSGGMKQTLSKFLEI